MATISQIRGLLLEEAVLYLLQYSGYQAVDETVSSDAALHWDSEGLKIKGRGETHQIGALAELMTTPPFTPPQRLIIEAKSYADATPVGLSMVRHTVGLLKDVDESWIRANSGDIPKRRYQYQYALFTTSRFSPEAQSYAFAQNIHLVQLAGIPELSPLLQSIHNINHNLFNARSWHQINIVLPELRRLLRQILHNQQDERLLRAVVPTLAVKPLMRVVHACGAIDGFYLATLDQHFTLPLVLSTPNWPDSITELDWHIKRHRNYWSLHPSQGQDPVFSFNFPPIFFQHHAQHRLFSTPPEFHIIKTADQTSQFLKLRLTAAGLDPILNTLSD